MRQAYGPPPPESKTISAIERKGARPEHRGAAPERQKRQKRQERHAGEIIPRRSRDKPPAPPCFRLRLRPRRGGSVRAKRVAENRRDVGKAEAARGDALGGRCSVCGLSAGVRCCAHLRWPTPVRQKVGQSCQRMGFPDVFWERTPKSGAQMQTGKRSLNTLRNASDITGKPKVVFQRSGARDLPSGGRADGGK